jgi:transposase
VPAGGYTLGLDLGDRSHYVCVLDAAGQIIHEGPMLNDRAALALLLTQYPAATVALEAGTHSPWISRYLTGLGAIVIVANPRRASTPFPATNASATAAMNARIFA